MTYGGAGQAICTLQCVQHRLTVCTHCFESGAIYNTETPHTGTYNMG